MHMGFLPEVMNMSGIRYLRQFTNTVTILKSHWIVYLKIVWMVNLVLSEFYFSIKKLVQEKIVRLHNFNF